MVNKGNKRHNGAVVKQVNIKRVLIAIALATAGLVVFTLASAHTYQEKQKVQLNKTLQEKVQLQKELEQNKLDSVENQKQIEQLKKDLQAKRDGQARALAESARVTPVRAAVAPSGDWVTNCHTWAAQAGITLNTAAIKLLERESHCNPRAWNASSGAGGIPQALPFSKTGCELSEAGAPCQLRWFQGYVMARYGSYEAALAHSYSHGWY